MARMSHSGKVYTRLSRGPCSASDGTVSSATGESRHRICIPPGEVRQHMRAADVLIDAHVWMRRREARMNRPLPLDNISDKKNLEPPRNRTM